MSNNLADITTIDKNTIFEIRNARIIYRDFGGKPNRFNPQGGKRSFSLVLTRPEADKLAALGLNVKSRDPREEGDDPLYHIKINIQFETQGRPPRVMMVSETKQTRLGADLVDILDDMEVKFVDIRFRAWEYDPGKYSTQLVTLFANIVEDDFEMRYASIPSGAPMDDPAIGDGPRFA